MYLILLRYKTSRTTEIMTVGSLICFLGKDFRFLKYFFCVLTLIWFSDELWNYLVRRPTLTSISQTYLDDDHIPQILLCPYPAHDLHSLHRVGYFHSFGQELQKKKIKLTRSEVGPDWPLQIFFLHSLAVDITTVYLVETKILILKKLCPPKRQLEAGEEIKQNWRKNKLLTWFLLWEKSRIAQTWWALTESKSTILCF